VLPHGRRAGMPVHRPGCAVMYIVREPSTAVIRCLTGEASEKAFANTPEVMSLPSSLDMMEAWETLSERLGQVPA
jgi:hypothetical protein